VRRAAGAVGAVGGLLALELAIVTIGRWDRVTGVWELQFGLLYLLPSLVLAAIAFGLAGAGLLALVERGQARPVRLALTIGFAIVAAGVAWGVGGGRNLSALPIRAGFSAGVALTTALVAFLLAPFLARAIQHRPRSVALFALAGCIGLELANRFILVRLYPAFHAALAVGALLLAAAMSLAFGAGRVRRPRWVAPTALLAATAAGVVSVVPAAARLAHFDNFRLLLLEDAPLLGSAVRAAALLAPPPPLPDDGCVEGIDCAPAPSPDGAGKRALELSGRDVLLVTIDALRADHVGAYGYGRPTTPQIDALAAGSALFTYAYCATPHTSYSVVSMMTGKYMRPLLLQGAGRDSDTWATLFRTYGYRTGAFYPAAVWFIDNHLFDPFIDSHLGFEYRKVEFMEGQGRVAQVAEFLNAQPREQPVFVWVHLFGPHEPYEAHPAHPFGDRDIDRYDSEIAAADATVGALVEIFRDRRADSVVIVSADHGEEFGDHGGRYHGTTVYEEQVRVPLVISAPGAIGPRRIPEPVQLIDLLPTMLSAIGVPQPPRLRGRDLGPLIVGARAPGPGLALAETEDQAMIAEGPYRMLCERKIGACRLYDLSKDPRQQRDATGDEPERARALRARLRELGASHGRYEVRGLRAEGKGWPAPILRGVTGDGDAAEEIAALLDDADLAVRRKAAELLFALRRPESAAALRLALSRDEDQDVKRWAALALTRLDEGAPLTFELAKSEQTDWRRLASLALAEAGDKRGEATLVAWWKDGGARDYERARELLAAFAAIRSRDAVWPLIQSLDDVRLRPHIARTLAAIGEPAARVSLVKAFAKERYQSSRSELAAALVELGAEAELAPAFVRFLGVPDPLPGGLELAARAGILEQIGGPNRRDRARLVEQSSLGVALTLIVPRGGNGEGVRALVRARSRGSAGMVHLGGRGQPLVYDTKGRPRNLRDLPRIDPARSLRLQVPVSDQPVEIHARLPDELGARPGRPLELVVFADRDVELEAIALVPLADELPPPPPGPWQPDGGAPAP
jgi:arylsulfatase A-like enzyme